MVKEIIVNITDALQLIACYENNKFLGVKTMDGNKIPHWDGDPNKNEVRLFMGYDADHHNRNFILPRIIDDETKTIIPFKTSSEML